MARYWFPAKRHGLGWGLPLTWQGWSVFVVFVLLLVLDAVLFPPSRRMPAFLGSVAVLAGSLLGVCWWKGEPPSSR